MSRKARECKMFSGAFFKVATTAAKVAATALFGAIASEIGLFFFKHLSGSNGRLFHIWHNVTGNVDVVFTAEQASAGAFSAQMNVIFAAGVAAASFSVIVGGMALGIKAYWKKHGTEENVMILEAVIVDEGITAQDQLDNSAVQEVDIKQEAELKFEDRAPLILYQAHVDARPDPLRDLQKNAPEQPHRRPEHLCKGSGLSCRKVGN